MPYTKSSEKTVDVKYPREDIHYVSAADISGNPVKYSWATENDSVAMVETYNRDLEVFERQNLSYIMVSGRRVLRIELEVVGDE